MDAEREQSGVRALAARLRDLLDDEHGFVGLTAQRIVDVRLIDTGLALSARLFVAVIPLSMLATAVTPVDDSFAGVLERSLGLNGAGARAARVLFATPDQLAAGVSVFGLIVLLYLLTSYARGLEGVYVKCWRLTRAGGELRQRLLWVVGLAVYLTIALTLDGLSGDRRSDDLERLVSAAAAVAFYTWTPYVLLGRRVSRRELVPTVVLTLVGAVLFAVASHVYMPSAASTQAERYGVVGFAFALLTWLFVQSVTIVAAAIVGAATTEWWRLRRRHAG